MTRSETNATINLLVVQRDDAQAAIIRDVFGGRDDFIVSHCADLASARLALKRAAPAPDVVLADLELADGQATALFADGPLPVVILAPGGDEARAVQAIKAGALDYVVKGPATLSNLPDIVRRARREWNVRLEREATQAQLAEKTSALEQMNDRLRMLLLLAQRVTLATSMDDCLDQFVRALSRELSAHSPKVWKGASDPESTDLAIRRAAEVARLQRRVTPYEDAEAEEARRFGLFVPIPPHGERSGLISLRRSQPFSAQDHVVAGLAVSFLEAALRSQATMNELRESQAQLHQSERMKSIGQLAGGVAHDFNNMLMVMSAAAEVMADTLPPDHPSAGHLQLILNTSHRAAELTQKLLAFSRKGRLAMKPVDIYEVLGAVREFLVHALDRRITLKSSLSPGPFLVDADSTQLQNVLLNICLNSRDAMPDGGALELSTKLIELDAATVSARVPEGRPGHYVCIEVRDTGTGMDAETLKHAFDPFFTTKEPGRGTGLGLSVVFGSIREHGGSVTLSSSPGKGSCCTLLLPQSTSAPGVATLPPSTGRSRRGLRVMLVDDEPGVCRTTAQLMRQLGHNVQALRSGGKALAHLKNHWGGYDLLVLDVMMPHPTGVEVHETLVEQGIVLPTVFVSGYSEQHMLEGITDGEGVVFLQKPFRQQELEAAIARCTQSGRGAGRKGPDGPAYSASQAPAPSQSSTSESGSGLSSDSSRPVH